MKVTLSRLLALVVVTASWLGSAPVARAQDDDDLVVSANPGATAPPPAPAPSAATAAPSGVEARLRALEEKNAALEARVKRDWLHVLLAPLHGSAFVQGDYHGSQLSEDQVQQGGVLYNEDRFLLKTARARLDARWKYAGAELELEANTVRGPTLRMYHAFGTLRLPNPKNHEVPIAAASIGQIDTPYGYELPESPRTRYFVDRTTSSRALFPGVPDLGLWLHGGLGPFRWSFAAMNGNPLDTMYADLAPVSAKQVVFRLGFETHARKDLEIAGGVSGLRGKGFHPGTDASKNLVAWTDSNEDGAIQPSELSGEAATAAVPSMLFDRWAIGADLQARLHTRLGTTTVYGEVTVADNLDRGLYVADPVFLGQDVRELGAYAAVTQQVTRWGVVGFRYDYYDPNLDAFDRREGKLIPTRQVIQTFSPLVGLVLPGRARLLFEYDFVRDSLGRSTAGIPADLSNDAWTLRLQVSL